MDNIDINKMLSVISKMNKDELEKNICKVQKILENSSFKETNIDDQKP